MFKDRYVRADALWDGRKITAEFDAVTGRLRILFGKDVGAVWFPPNSWFAIASVASQSNWGTCPTPADLQLVIDEYTSGQA